MVKIINPFKNYQSRVNEAAQFLSRGDRLGALAAAVPSPLDFGWTEARAQAADTAAYESQQDTPPTEWEKNGTPYGEQPISDPNPFRASGSGSGSGTAVTPNIATFNGQSYDLNNASDIQRYIQDKDGYFNNVFDTFRKNAGEAKDLDILQANEEEKKAQYEIAQALEKLSNSENEYNRTYAKNLKDLYDGFVSGSANRQNYYAQISPLVAQSAQAEGQAFAQGKYDTAVSDAEHAKEQAGKEFGSARTQYAQQQQDIGKQINLFKLQRENQYNQDLESKKQELQGYKDENRTVGENAMRSVNSKFGGFTGLNPITYDAKQADFSQYTPYINFQPVANQGSSVNGFKVQTQQALQPGTASLNRFLDTGTPQTEVKSIDEWLGRK